MTISLKKSNLISIPGDASFRKFFRIIEKNGNSKILIKCKKEKYKNLILYSSINNYLRKNKILAPKTFLKNFKKGYIIVEDFGDLSFCNVLKKTKSKFKVYKKIIDFLLKIQKIKINKKIIINSNRKYIFPYYNINNLHKESDLFIDWYLPLIKKKSKKKFEIKYQLNKLYKKINFENKFFVHRDFHVSNLIKFKKKIAVIDSQDAMIGNPAYDLLSLIDDVRLVTSNKLKNKVYDYYMKRSSKIFNFNKKNFKIDFNILSVQRSLKIIGIFSRLYKRDGKRKYLKLIPYAWKLLENRYKDEIFKDLRSTLNKVAPLKIRKKLFYEN